MTVINPQQYQLREERTERTFLAYRSQKTSLERLAEDIWRMDLLQSGQALDDAMDSTMIGDSVQPNDQGNK